MVLKAILFDFDGVIYPSPHYVYLARKRFFKKYKINFKKKDFKKYFVSSTTDFVNSMNKEYNINVDIEKMHMFTRTEFIKLIKNRYTPNLGIRELLKELTKNKIKIGISSSNRRKIILYDLNKLGLKKYFKVIVSVEDVLHSKPSPETYLLTASKLKVHPRECVGIEDAPEGIIGMKKNGIKTIGLLSEFTTSNEFKKVKADLIVKSTRNLTLDMFKNLINDNVITKKKKSN